MISLDEKTEDYRQIKRTLHAHGIDKTTFVTPWNKFLESWWSLCWLRNFQPFMENEVSLPCSQEPATFPCPKSDESIHPFTHYFPNIHINIILPSIRKVIRKTTFLSLVNSDLIFKQRLPRNSQHKCYAMNTNTELKVQYLLTNASDWIGQGSAWTEQGSSNKLCHTAHSILRL
jgi:hypothetical protein